MVDFIAAGRRWFKETVGLMAQANPTGDTTEVIIQVDAAEAAERTAQFASKSGSSRPARLRGRFRRAHCHDLVAT